MFLQCVAICGGGEPQQKLQDPAGLTWFLCRPGFLQAGALYHGGSLQPKVFAELMTLFLVFYFN